MKPRTRTVVIVAHDVDPTPLSHPFQLEAEPLLLQAQLGSAGPNLGSPACQGTVGETHSNTEAYETGQVMGAEKAEKGEEDLQQQKPSRLDG